MVDLLKKMRTAGIMSSVVVIVLGLFLVLWPHLSLDVVVYLMAFIIALIGLVRVVNYYQLPQEMRSTWELVVGIGFVALGLFMCFAVNTVISVMTFLVGIYITIEGLVGLIHSNDLRNIGYDSWRSGMLLCALLLILGIVFLFNPFTSMRVLVLMIGLVFIINGIINLYMIHSAKKADDLIAHEFDM